MNRSEERGSPKHRPDRVVSLPCGHQISVADDASLLALSAPVLDHQSTCRPESSPSYPAWFPSGPMWTSDSGPPSTHRPTAAPLFG